MSDNSNNILTNGNAMFCGTPNSEGNLGGNLYYGDLASFSPNTIDYVIKRFGIKSVLDVGSGQGYLPWLIHTEYKIPVMGIEGFPSNLKNSVYPLIYWDLNKGPFKCTSVDLVTCVEVVEHIAEEKIDNLLDTLCLGKVILMTHAQPNTKGEYHVNEQSDEYWINKLTSRGYNVMPSDTVIVRKIDSTENHGGGYFMGSGLVFVRKPQGEIHTA